MQTLRICREKKVSAGIDVDMKLAMSHPEKMTYSPYLGPHELMPITNVFSVYSSIFLLQRGEFQDFTRLQHKKT
jgi:hypothetical protein